jgi:hypothetical protein
MKYSNQVSGCSVAVAWITGYQHTGHMVANSRFCGWWKSNTTDNLWSSAACVSITR